MNRTILFLSLSFLFLFANCRDNDPEILYDLIIVNSFNSDLEIYLTDGTGNDTFENRGILGALNEITITGLSFDTEYVLRSLQIGNDLNNFLTEDTFTNTDADQIEYTIRIEF